MRIASLVNFDDNSHRKYEGLVGQDIICIQKEKVSCEELDTIEVLVCRDRDLTEEFIEKCTNLKMIFVVSAGVERVPFAFVREKGILVANAAGICDDSISDYVLGTMLAFSCKIYDCVLYKEQSYWKPYLYTNTLRGKNLTIVGTGRIGKAICLKAKAFGLNVTGIRRNVKPEDGFDRIDSIANLDRILPESDYVVSTVPLTEETYHLFDSDKFTKMKESAVFINISRGKVVDEAALLCALKKKNIYGAALDVFETEPLPKESKLWEAENLIISPHSSGRLSDFMDYAMEIFAVNYDDYKNARKLTNQVNLDLGY